MLLQKYRKLAAVSHTEGEHKKIVVSPTKIPGGIKPSIACWRGNAWRNGNPALPESLGLDEDSAARFSMRVSERFLNVSYGLVEFR
jgi:hypothetical protein